MADQAPERIDRFKAHPFIDGPAEFLCKSVAKNIELVKQFKLVFGDAIDDYKRMDYPMRSLPALRIYCLKSSKDYESWYVNGDLTVDVIWPPSIRRKETQQLPSTIAAALWQQFRRDSFFQAVSADVPGLNELGKRITVDGSLGFLWGEGEDEIIPLTQFAINFRLDLRIWDSYLEAQGRTKDDPFEVTLENLELVASTIQALRDDGSNDIAIETDVEITSSED